MSVAVDEETFWLGDWRVEPALNRTVRGEEIVRIDPRNMKVLQLLASQPGHVFSQAEIEQAVWEDVIVTSNSVYQSIAQLRRALGDGKDNLKYIETIPRRGYRLIAPVSRATLDTHSSSVLQAPQRITTRRIARNVLVSVILGGSALGILGYYGRHASSDDYLSTSSSGERTELSTPLTLSELPEAAELQPRLLVELATVSLAHGKSREARDYLTRALTLVRSRVGEHHPQTAGIQYELAMVHVWESDYPAAEAAAYAALDTFSAYPESHPQRIAATNRLGYVLLESGKYDQSEVYLTKAVQLSTEVFGENSTTTTEALMNLGILRLSQGRLTEAEHLARQGIAISEPRGPALDTAAYNKSLLIAALLKQSRYEEAHELCNQVLSSLEGGLRANHPLVVAIRDLRGKSLLGLGQYEVAEVTLRENIGLWQQNDGWSVRAAGSASALAEALLGQGRLAEASEYLARASLEIDGTQKERDAQERFREHQARLDKLRVILERDRNAVAEAGGLVGIRTEVRNLEGDQHPLPD